MKLKFLLLAVIATTSLLASNQKNESQANTPLKVLAFAGSTRKESLNKKLILEAARIAEHLGAEVTVINLEDYPMPIYDQDLEEREGQPINAKRFRALMQEHQAFIIANPEYNASLSGVLKNAIDWASRTEDGQPTRDVFKGKKFAIMTACGGLGQSCMDHLKTMLSEPYYFAAIVVDPQLIVAHAYQAFSPEGFLLDENLKQQLVLEITNLLN